MNTYMKKNPRGPWNSSYIASYRSSMTLSSAGNDFHKVILSFNFFLSGRGKWWKAAGLKTDLCIHNVTSKIHNKWRNFTSKQARKESKEQIRLSKQGLGIGFLVPKLLHGDSWEGTTDHSSHTFVHSTLIKVHASNRHRINIPAGMLRAK